MLCYKPLSAYSNKNARNFVMCTFFVCTYACTYNSVGACARALLNLAPVFFQSVFRSDKSLLKNTLVIYCCYVSVHIHFSVFFIYLLKFIDNYKTSIQISAVHWSPAPTKIFAQSVDLAYLWFRRSASIPPTKPLKTTPTALLL